MDEIFQRLRGHSLFIQGIPKTPCVLDLGANHGEFSACLNQRFGGTYHLIEANPLLVAELAKETPFEVINAAVTAECGTVRFNIAKNDEGSSILTLPESSVYDAVLVSTVQVPGLNIDTICDGIKSSFIDVVKIDIEGAEVSALLACSDAALRRMGQITVEFHCDPSFGYDLKEGTEQVLKKLDRLGFVILDFSKHDRDDVLFLNRSHHKISALREFVWKKRLHPSSSVSFIWRMCPAFVRSILRKILRVCGFDSTSYTRW